MADITVLLTELRILIIDHLDRASDSIEQEDRVHRKVNADLLYLSCVNRSFHWLAAPYLFRKLVLRNSAKNGTSVNLIAGSKYAKLVKKLEFIGSSTLAYHDVHGPAPGHGEWTDVVLPQSVEYALSNLRAFPALEAISVEFAVEGNNSFISEDDFPDNFVEIQDTYSAFMDAVYTALARNSANKIKYLYLLNVRAPSPYTSWSSWESKEWRTFLNGLTTIHLSVNAGDGSCGVAMEGYCNEVLPLLKPLCWDHLRNVTHLSFSPSQNGFLGADRNLCPSVPMISRISRYSIWIMCSWELRS